MVEETKKEVWRSTTTVCFEHPQWSAFLLKFWSTDKNKLTASWKTWICAEWQSDTRLEDQIQQIWITSVCSSKPYRPRNPGQMLDPGAKSRKQQYPHVCQFYKWNILLIKIHHKPTQLSHTPKIRTMNKPSLVLLVLFYSRLERLCHRVHGHGKWRIVLRILETTHIRSYISARHLHSTGPTPIPLKPTSF